MFKRRLSATLAVAMISMNVLGLGGVQPVFAEEQQAKVDSLLKVRNSGFEEKASEKIPGWEVTSKEDEQSSLTVSSEKFKSGSMSLHLKDTSTTANASLQSDKIDVLPGRKYVTSANFYAFNPTSTTNAEQPQNSNKIAFEVQYLDNNGDVISVNDQTLSTVVDGPSNDWKKVELENTAPAGAQSMRILFSSAVEDTASFYIDDVAVSTDVDPADLPVTEVVYPVKAADLAAGSNFELKVKADQDAVIEVTENGAIVAEGEGKADEEVSLLINAPAVGEHKYKVSSYAKGLGSGQAVEVPAVTVHAFTGIQLDKENVRLKEGEQHTVVTQAVYGPVLQDISSFVKLEASPQNIVEIDGSQVKAVKEGVTVVTATYGEKQAKLKVRVSNSTENLIESLQIKLPKTTISVQESVYAAVYADYWIGGDLKTLEIKEGVTLTANPSYIVKIDGLKVTGASNGTTVIQAVYDDTKATFELTVQGGNTGGGGGWFPPVDNSAKQKATKEQLQLKNGVASITFEKGKHELLVPVGAIEWLADGILEVVRDEATLRIPASMLKDMLDKLELKADKVDYFSITLKPTTNGVVLVELAVIEKNGKVHAYKDYSKQVQLLMPISTGKDARFLGIYSIVKDKADTFVGGKRSGNMLTANLQSNGEYAINEFNKSFTDVPSSHWASMAIRTLTAKHIVNGVNDTQYRPNGLITRAEFAAIVARAFELKAPDNVKTKFKDVSENAWYAEAVAAVYAADVTRGISADTFAPNAQITREEMLVMLVRASGAKADGTQANLKQKFKDANAISSWAQEAVSIAAGKGWVQGNPNGKFEPKATATRAESAMMIYNLFKDVFN
ncbi:S-layer homology domain-containing protein [Paenibacillus marinisediminis]